MEEAATGLIVQIECGGGRGRVQNIEMCKTQKCAKHRNKNSAKKYIFSLVNPGFSNMVKLKNSWPSKDSWI